VRTKPSERSPHLRGNRQLRSRAMEHPPVPEAWWPVIRDHMPGFDPQITPSQGVGALPEVVRMLMSFAAIGPQAEPITAGHVLESGLGKGSPLARLYELDAAILLLGVGHASNT
jgi:aminoglycoside 3-N-acetyltransferase